MGAYLAERFAELGGGNVVANAGVIIAAFLVRRLNSPWPDIAIGAFIAGMILRSGVKILVESFRELKERPA